MDLQNLASDPAAFRDRLLIPTPGGPQRLGAVAADFQRQDFAAMDSALRSVAGLDAGGTVYRRAWLERCKSCSKDTDAAVSALWLLVASRRPLTLQIAACDQEQAGLVKRAADDILRLNAWLAGLVESQVWAVLNRRTGSRLEILAHDIAGAHGARPDAVWLNELSHFPSRDFADVLVANVAKNPAALLTVLTNAGFEGSYAAELRREAERSARWYFSVFDSPPPWVDREDIEEQSRILPAKMFARLWRGVWSGGGGDAIPDGDIDMAFRLAGPASGPERGWLYVLAGDLGVRRDNAALVVLGVHCGWWEEREREPRVESGVLAAMRDCGLLDDAGDDEPESIFHPGSGLVKLSWCRIYSPRDSADGEVSLQSVEDDISHQSRIFHFARVGLDPWQGHQMVQRLRASGLPAEAVDFVPGALRGMAAETLGRFRDGTVALYPHPVLEADLRAMRAEEKSYGLRLTSPRGPGGHGDAATSLALGLYLCRDLQGTQTTTVDRPLICYP